MRSEIRKMLEAWTSEVEKDVVIVQHRIKGVGGTFGVMAYLDTPWTTALFGSGSDRRIGVYGISKWIH